MQPPFKYSPLPVLPVFPDPREYLVLKMLSSQTHLLSRILLLLFFVRVAFADTLTVTITAYPGFLSQRSCAIYCYVNAFDGQYYDLGCETPVENACYCRDDLISSWANSLSSCVSASCSGNSEDVDSATSIYEGYCSSNGYVAGAAAATTRTGRTPILLEPLDRQL